MTDNSVVTADGRRIRIRSRFPNSWPVVPLRIFLAFVFAFAGYAKLTYPRFFAGNSVTGFKASVDAAKADSPISGLLGPLSDHYSLFGHLTAYAEIAIGLGLLVGFLTRLASLGGIVLMVMVALSINYGGIKEYTGSSGWYTSVDFAITAALTVFLIGGAGPLSLDSTLAAINRRRRDKAAAEDAEDGYADSNAEDSRRRLRGDDVNTSGSPGYPAATGTSGYSAPAAGGSAEPPTTGYRSDADRDSHVDTSHPDTSHPDTSRSGTSYTGASETGTSNTERLPSNAEGQPAGTRTEADSQQSDPEPEPESLWTRGRRNSPS